MAVTAQASGTQTAVIGTEHQLADTNVSGVFTFVVDRDAMVDGDILELRIYEMVLTSGTSRLLYFMAYYGAPPGKGTASLTFPSIVTSEAVSNELTDATALRFSLKQTFGTGRAYPWKVLRHN